MCPTNSTVIIHQWRQEGKSSVRGGSRPGRGTSLVVQWLRLHAPNAGGPGSIPSQGTGSHMLQLRIPHVATKISHAAIKSQSSQIHKENK